MFSAQDQAPKKSLLENLSYKHLRCTLAEFFVTEQTVSIQAGLVSKVLEKLLQLNSLLQIEDYEKKFLQKSKVAFDTLAQSKGKDEELWGIPELNSEENPLIKMAQSGAHTVYFISEQKNLSQICEIINTLNATLRTPKKKDLIVQRADAIATLTIFYDVLRSIFARLQKQSPVLWKNCVENTLQSLQPSNMRLDIFSLLVVPLQRFARWSLLSRDLQAVFKKTVETADHTITIETATATEQSLSKITEKFLTFGSNLNTRKTTLDLELAQKEKNKEKEKAKEDDSFLDTLLKLFDTNNSKKIAPATKKTTSQNLPFFTQSTLQTVEAAAMPQASHIFGASFVLPLAPTNSQSNVIGDNETEAEKEYVAELKDSTEFWKNLKNLESSIQHYLEGSIKLSNLAECVKGNKLDLSNRNITDADIPRITEFLKLHENITMLDVSSNHISAVGAGNLAKALLTQGEGTQSNSDFKLLIISNNEIGAKGIKKIRENNANLHVRAENCGITNDEAKDISIENMTQSSVYTSLRVANNELKEDGIKALQSLYDSVTVESFKPPEIKPEDSDSDSKVDKLLVELLKASNSSGDQQSDHLSLQDLVTDAYKQQQQKQEHEQKQEQLKQEIIRFLNSYEEADNQLTSDNETVLLSDADAHLDSRKKKSETASADSKDLCWSLITEVLDENRFWNFLFVDEKEKNKEEKNKYRKALATTQDPIIQCIRIWIKKLNDNQFNESMLTFALNQLQFINDGESEEREKEEALLVDNSLAKYQREKIVEDKLNVLAELYGEIDRLTKKDSHFWSWGGAEIKIIAYRQVIEEIKTSHVTKTVGEILGKMSKQKINKKDYTFFWFDDEYCEDADGYRKVMAKNNINVANNPTIHDILSWRRNSWSLFSSDSANVWKGLLTTYPAPAAKKLTR